MLQVMEAHDQNADVDRVNDLIKVSVRYFSKCILIGSGHDYSIY